MKKSVILLIIIFLASGALVSAQTNKGNWFLAGNSELSHQFGKQKYKYDGNTSDGYKFAHFDFAPMGGYFFIDNLVGGIFIDNDIDTYKDPDDDDKYVETTLSAGPFARYYVFPQDRWKPFVHAQAGFGFYREKETYSSGTEYIYKEGYFSYLAGIGIDFFLNDHVALDAMLGFNHEVWKEIDDDNEDRAETARYIYNSFGLKIGVVVILGKN